MSKKEKVVDLKPKAEKISKEQLSKVQDTVNGINKGQLEIGHISEEHTSELQSQSTISYAVFCLKKKTNLPIWCCDATQSKQNQNH